MPSKTIRPKIYFAGSIRGGRENAKTYLEIIRHLESRHGKVLTEHLGDVQLSDAGQARPDSTIYQQDITWLKAADVLVADVSTPSLGVGYEIGIAESLKLPVICLFNPKVGRKLSAMIQGNPKIFVLEYSSPGEACGLLDEIFHKIVVMP
jgi:2'-deoxynucleoside 5'-phosphate N-hydrolase